MLQSLQSNPADLETLDHQQQRIRSIIPTLYSKNGGNHGGELEFHLIERSSVSFLNTFLYSQFHLILYRYKS